MDDKCLRELAYWLNNNTDWTVDMPKIFTGVEQDKLEKFLKGDNKMKYVLRADTEEGSEYYMNIICVTQDAKDAMHYSAKEEAQKDMEHFKKMFHCEEVQPIIEEYEEGRY